MTEYDFQIKKTIQGGRVIGKLVFTDEFHQWDKPGESYLEWFVNNMCYGIYVPESFRIEGDVIYYNLPLNNYTDLEGLTWACGGCEFIKVDKEEAGIEELCWEDGKGWIKC